MPAIDPEALAKIITDALESFYKKRLQALNGLKLKKVLRRKNPYLYKAMGYEQATKIVEDLLKAYITSSDETIFGTEFFERVGLEVATKMGIGHKALSDSVDVEIHVRAMKRMAKKAKEKLLGGE